MFERFTDRGRRVCVLAQEEARMLHHDYIGTEHILLGLIHEGEGVASKALQGLGISLEGVRTQVEEIIGHGQQAPSGHIPFTPRAKKTLELSLREALQLGHNYIGTEHILLGLIREGEGVAAQVLVKLGAELTRVRQQVIQLLGEHAPVQPPPPAMLIPGLEKAVRAAAAAGLDEIAIHNAVIKAIKEATELAVGSSLRELDDQIAAKRREKEAAIDAREFDTAADLRDDEKKLVAQRAAEHKRKQELNRQFQQPEAPRPDTVHTSLTDEQFERFKTQLRYEVTDVFTGNSRIFPLIWEGRRLIGIDWGDFDMGQKIS